MSKDNEEIAEFLNIDPIDAAEKRSGKSYKEDEETLQEGLFNSFFLNKMKNSVLDSIGDTRLTMKVDDYMVIASAIGFEIVYVEDFVDKWGLKEKIYILWNKKGILLYFDTYEGKVNGGTYCFNWVPKDGSTDSEKWDVLDFCRISGGFIKEKDSNHVLVGSIDCREALKTRISILEERGKFLDKWVKEPFYRFMHHEDWNSRSAQNEEVTKERFDKLPDYVRNSIRSNHE